MFAKLLSDDEKQRLGGRKYHAEVHAWVAREAEREGREPLPPMFPLESIPERGMSSEDFQLQRGHLADELRLMQSWLARGDTSAVADDTNILLADAEINLDPHSEAYHELSVAVMQQYVRALKAIEQRNAGEAIETPRVAKRSSVQSAQDGATLGAALEGWRKDKDPSGGVLAEYKRAIELFTQLHGDIPVAQITRAHARTFREALQQVPWPRAGHLARAPLPELVEWSSTHPEAGKISRASVNKQLGGVQTIAKWARRNGIIPTMWLGPTPLPK